MTNELMEILSGLSHEIPSDTPMRYLAGGEPLFIAFGCALLEREAGSGYIYRAVNLSTGKSEVLSVSTKQLTTSGVPEMLEKIRLSSIADTEQQLEGDDPDDTESDDDTIEDIMVDKLREALFRLAGVEHALIEALYFSNYSDEISERE